MNKQMKYNKKNHMNAIEEFLGKTVLLYSDEEKICFPKDTPGKNDFEKELRWRNKCAKNAMIVLNSKNDEEVKSKLMWIVKNRNNFK